jgi:hypothetical protein
MHVSAPGDTIERTQQPTTLPQVALTVRCAYARIDKYYSGGMSIQHKRIRCVYARIDKY